MTPFPPVLARYERFIYTKRKLLCIRKQQGLEFKLEKKISYYIKFVFVEL